MSVITFSTNPRIIADGAYVTTVTSATWDSRPNGVNVGDILQVTDTGMTYVWSVLDIDANAGGGTMGVWLPPDVALWSSPVVRAYLTGDENPTQRSNKGWLDGINGTGTVTGDFSGSGYTRFNTAGFQDAGGIYTADGEIGATSKVYVRAKLRGSTGGLNSSAAGFFITDGTNVVRFYAVGPTGFGFRENTIRLFSPTNANEPRSGGTVISTTPVIAEVIDEGRTVYSRASIDHVDCHATRRVKGTSGLNRVDFRAYSDNSSNFPYLDVADVLVVIS